ncbi:MAG: response regulator [Vicinamibacterales bacterium]
MRLLLADDHPVMRRGVAEILRQHFPDAVVDEADSIAQALSLAPHRSWDLVVLDLSLSDGSGLDLLKRLRETQPRVPVLILSVHTAEQFARRAIAAGASGYLTKDAADTELMTAITTLIRGGKYFNVEVLEQVAIGVHADYKERPHERLSDREYEVFLMIGSGKTVSEIASILGLSVKTVSTYRSRVMDKMELRTNAELTHYALSHQLITW